MVGSVKSLPGTRSGPRSSPTTLRPALVSSRARIDPVQPMPTITASTSFRRVAMTGSLLRVCAAFDSLVDLEKRDHVVEIPAVGDTAERHAVALHLALRIGDERSEVGLVPDEVGAHHRGRIAVVVE